MNKSSFDTDVLVIGAGIIGLSVAREIAKKGIDTIVVEKIGLRVQRLAPEIAR